MLKVYSEMLNKIEKVSKIVITFFSIVMVGSIILQVILRYFFHSANAWSEELARYVLFYVTMFSAVIALRKGSHLQVDFLKSLLPTKITTILNIACMGAGIGFLLFLTKYSIILCSMTSNSISAGLKIPMSYIYISIPVASILMILSALEIIFNEFAELKSMKKGENK